MIIYDIDIARWASRVQEEENVPGFKVSNMCIRIVKHIHNILSHKIIKFTVKKIIISKSDIVKLKCNICIN